jgi:ABC-2 type transport system ATP-binding protein
MPAVEVRDLVVRYGDVVAVDGLSLTAEAGGVTALLGPNGAGKTSTVEVLEGYRRPTSGTARVVGLDPQTDHTALTWKMGVMLQSGGVYPGVRAHEAVRLFCAIYGDRQDPDELLGRVGLANRARSTWKELSGGEQQRLSLALALAGTPSVAFLDEPTAGVDVEGRLLVREVIRELAASGCCVLLATHDLEEAEKVADTVVIIDHGRLVASGTPDELRRQGADEIRFGARPGLDVAALAARLGGPVTEVHPGEYVAAVPPGPAAVAALTAWLAERDEALGDLRAGRQSLEDVFLRLTGERSAAEAEHTPARRRRRGRS